MKEAYNLQPLFRKTQSITLTYLSRDAKSKCQYEILLP